MSSKQPGSQFWGTGFDLTHLRESMDPLEAREFLAVLSRRVFGNTYDYSLIEFRALNLPVKFKVNATGEVFETTPYRHLMTEDGRGY